MEGSILPSREFLRYFLTRTGMMPNEEMLKSIRDFPRLKDILGIRSFFGLVERVSWALNKCNDMAPFRPLISPIVEFESIIESMKKEVSMVTR